MPTATDFVAQVCIDDSYTGWAQMFYCIQPQAWAFVGLAVALGLSIVGAAW